MDVVTYLRDRRRTIFWDEHLWYVHLLALWVLKDRIAWGEVAFFAVLVYGGACMVTSYAFHWRLERSLLLHGALRDADARARAVRDCTCGAVPPSYTAGPTFTPVARAAG